MDYNFLSTGISQRPREIFAYLLARGLGKNLQEKEAETSRQNGKKEEKTPQA
jgi:hypothetical protein